MIWASNNKDVSQATLHESEPNVLCALGWYFPIFWFQALDVNDIDFNSLCITLCAEGQGESFCDCNDFHVPAATQDRKSKMVDKKLPLKIFKNQKVPPFVNAWKVAINLITEGPHLCKLAYHFPKSFPKI